MYHFEIRNLAFQSSYRLPITCHPCSLLSKGTRTVASNPSWQHRAFASKRFFSKTSLHLNKTSWWFQTLHLKICLSKWIIFPSTGKNKKIKKVSEPAPLENMFLSSFKQAFQMMELPSTESNCSLQFRIAYIVLVLAFQFHRKFLQSISVQNCYKNACCYRPCLKIWGVSSQHHSVASICVLNQTYVPKQLVGASLGPWGGVPSCPTLRTPSDSVGKTTHIKV